MIWYAHVPKPVIRKALPLRSGALFLLNFTHDVILLAFDTLVIDPEDNILVKALWRERD